MMNTFDVVVGHLTVWQGFLPGGRMSAFCDGGGLGSDGGGGGGGGAPGLE